MQGRDGRQEIRGKRSASSYSPSPHRIPSRPRALLLQSHLCLRSHSISVRVHPSGPRFSRPSFSTHLPPLGSLRAPFLLGRQALSGCAGFVICAVAGRKQLFAVCCAPAGFRFRFRILFPEGHSSETWRPCSCPHRNNSLSIQYNLEHRWHSTFCL